MPPPPPAPRRFEPLLAAKEASRPARARALLDDAPDWPALRASFGRAIAADPIRAAAALGALRTEAERRTDRALAARVRALEGRASHRAGRIAEALATYADAERRLARAGLSEEASLVGVGRVDALAASGRVDGALALAARLERALPPSSPTTLRASLAVNRANALRLRGDVERATALYDAAARLLDAAGSRYSAEVARFNAGVAALEAGDVEEARRRFARAATEFAALGAADAARQARGNLAWADVHGGRLGSAIGVLDVLAQEHRDEGAPEREGLVRLDLADALRRAGDAGAAEREALRAAVAFRAAGSGAEAAEALWFAAAAALDAPARAGRHLREARRAAAAGGREGVVLRCDVLLTDVAHRTGTSPTSRALAGLGRRARALGLEGLVADVLLLDATVALDRGDGRRARRILRRVAASAAGRPWTRIAAETGLAAAEALVPGGVATALVRLRRVVRGLDAIRAELPGAWLRASFTAERLDPRLTFVDLLLRRGRPADRREAEAVLDALRARGGLRVPPVAGRDPRLARARARLEALYDRLARGEGPTRGSEAGFLGETLLERRARRIERAIAEIWRREERLRGGKDVRPATLRRASVAPAAARIHVWRHGDRVRALVRTRADVGDAVDLLSTDDWEGFSESLRIRAHRFALVRGEPAAAANTDDAAGFERVLAELADAILPALRVERFPDDVRVLPDPSLPDLPWELLPWRGARLSERFRILRVPGAGRGRGRPSGSGARPTVVIGVGDRDLPGVGREVRAIAQAAAAAGAPVETFTGARATKAAVLDALGRAGVVHLAGHGWDAGEAPPLGGVRVHDGWLTAADVAGRPVRADLVILAACRTGRTSGRAHEAWGGLVPALLGAGARRVVWTTDDVDDDTTASLMARFHALRASCDDRRAFGLALARGAGDAGHAGAVLAFRISGVES